MPPERIGGRISDRDYPRGLSDAGVSGTVSVRYRVGIDGRASDCRITHSSGSDALDSLTCSLIVRRFRFRPARDGEGQPVPSTIIENHSWIIPAASGEGEGPPYSQR
jgi:periplasmic protein TonB